MTCRAVLVYAIQLVCRLQNTRDNQQSWSCECPWYIGDYPDATPCPKLPTASTLYQTCPLFSGLPQRDEHKAAVKVYQHIKFQILCYCRLAEITQRRKPTGNPMTKQLFIVHFNHSTRLSSSYTRYHTDLDNETFRINHPDLLISVLFRCAFLMHCWHEQVCCAYSSLPQMSLQHHAWHLRYPLFKCY